MIYQSPTTIDIPKHDILSHAFPPDSNIPPSHPIFVDPCTNQSITRAQAHRLIRQLIAGLRHHGISSNDTICLHAFNSIHYPLIYLAAIGAGARFVGSNPAYKPKEVRHLLQAANVNLLFVQESEVGRVLETALEVGLTSKQIVILGEGNESVVVGLKSWKTLLSHGEMHWRTFNDEIQAKSAPAVFLSTSGTTGLPKMAVMSHYAIVTQAVMAEYVAGECSMEEQEGFSAVNRLISLPVFHSFVLPYHILALRRGETTFVMPRFDADDFATFIERHSITDVPTVPPIALRLFGDEYRGRDLSSLKDVVCAGAPLAKETQLTIRKRLGGQARFWQLWGMSETGWVTAFRHPEADESGGSVGRLLPNVQAKIADSNGKEVDVPGAQGEIYVRHPGCMTCYLGSSMATDDVFKDGWFKTGDIGYCENGKWFIVDRAKEMIKVRAWTVSPAEIEACVISHLGVADVAVIGVAKDADTGEVPVAFIVPLASPPHREQLIQEVKGKVNRELASYKSLGEVVIVESIPRTASGKILRRVLRDAYICSPCENPHSIGNRGIISINACAQQIEEGARSKIGNWNSEGMAPAKERSIEVKS